MYILLVYIHHVGLQVAAQDTPVLSPAVQDNLLRQLEDAKLAKEIEKLVANLNDDQLDQLEAILAKDLDTQSEFSMLLEELQEMGMQEDDIEDLNELANMMNKFLLHVPDLDKQLRLEQGSYNLLDNCKLYLLGLPNKLGPLGFLALHSVLLDDVDEHVGDVRVEGFEPPASLVQAAADAPRVEPVPASAMQLPPALFADPITKPQAEDQHQHAPQPSPGTGAGAALSSLGDIVARRRRAIFQN